MKAFLGSAVVQRNDAVMLLTSRNNKKSTLIVPRGNYANPCMAFITMYNVYAVIEHFWVVHPTII
jgi:hypothetical protein